LGAQITVYARLIKDTISLLLIYAQARGQAAAQFFTAAGKTGSDYPKEMFGIYIFKQLAAA
jgi:hypothetical protein